MRENEKMVVLRLCKGWKFGICLAAEQPMSIQYFFSVGFVIMVVLVKNCGVVGC